MPSVLAAFLCCPGERPFCGPSFRAAFEVQPVQRGSTRCFPSSTLPIGRANFRSKPLLYSRPLLLALSRHQAWRANRANRRLSSQKASQIMLTLDQPTCQLNWGWVVAKWILSLAFNYVCCWPCWRFPNLCNFASPGRAVFCGYFFRGGSKGSRKDTPILGVTCNPPQLAPAPNDRPSRRDWEAHGVPHVAAALVEGHHGLRPTSNFGHRSRTCAGGFSMGKKTGSRMQ